jgi:hypothetical protein
MWIIFAANVIGVYNTWSGVAILGGPTLLLGTVAAVFIGLAIYRNQWGR